MTPSTTNSLLPPLGAALPEYPEFLDTLVYQLNGLVVVFIALGLIWGMLEVAGLCFKRHPQPASQPVAMAPAEPENAGTPAEIMAAIAAAVHVTLGSEHRIASIVPLETSAHDWALEGRRQIHSARKVR